MGWYRGMFGRKGAERGERTVQAQKDSARLEARRWTPALLE